MGEGEAGLIERARRGDRAAFGALYDLHAPAMLGRAVRMLGQRAAAEDLVHDVFLEAWRKLEAFDPDRGAFSAWLGARLRSRAIDRLRALRPPSELVSPAEDPADPAADRLDPGDRVDAGRVHGWLESLAGEQREAIELAYFSGLTIQEIAAKQGVPEGTVKARIHRGIAKLRLQKERS